MRDWILDRVAHFAFHRVPNDVFKPKWGWRERFHIWGVERCAERHFDTCWIPVEDMDDQ